MKENLQEKLSGRAKLAEAEKEKADADEIAE